MTEKTTADLKHDAYTQNVHEGRYAGGPRVPLPPPFDNDKGSIQNLLLKPCASVTEIRSKKGSTRANHYHKEDWHYAFVVSGKVLYFERAIGETAVEPPIEVLPGEMFFTPPMREHCMLFAEDSVIITMAKRVRTHEEHEADVVRVAYVTPELAAWFVK
jgi:quercetin dioxygenase-like cupin family protein